VERVVLNALEIVRLCRLIIRAFGDCLGIVFGEADRPLKNLGYRLRPNEYPRWVLPPPMARLPPAADSGSNNAVYK
jgi:hypothetical protein